MNSATERVKVKNPLEKLNVDLEKVRRRIATVTAHESLLPQLAEIAEKAAPEHVLVEIQLFPEIDYNDKEEVSIEIALTQVQSWRDVAELLEALDEIGYDIEKWTTADAPQYLQRTYFWETIEATPLRLRIEACLDEAATECRRVLVRVEQHSSSYSEKIYAFDCGEGAEQVIRRANEKTDDIPF
jgi:hypothetical protein